LSDTATPTAITTAPDLEALSADSLSFEAFERSRNTGEMPPKEETPSAAAAEAPTGDEPPARTAEDPDASGDQKQEPEPVEQPGDKPRKGGVQKRIDQLTRDKRELEARLAALEAKPPAAGGEKPAEAAPAPVDDGNKPKPKSEDVEHYDDYVDALTDWKAEQRDKAHIAETRRSEAEQAARAAQDTWQSLEAAVAAEHADYHDVLSGCEFTCSAQEYSRFATIVRDFERGPELLYRLAQSPRDLDRIIHLGPTAIARELTKIEIALPSGKPASDQKPAAASTPRSTGAPNPVTPITGGKGAAVTSLDDPNLSYPDWERKRDEQLLARRR
jgi:hypothetical protein